MNSEKKKYITGLKGLACLSVMFGHYFQIFHAADTQCFSVIEFIRSSPFKYIIGPGYWLQLFFVISGYLTSKTRISSPGELIEKSILRFLRFALPVFAVYMLLFAIDKTVGFHNAETAVIFKAVDFQQNNYIGTRSFSNYLVGPIRLLVLGDCNLNGPYWVLHAMFISSLYIYAMKHLKKYVPNDGLFFSVQVIAVAVFMFTDKKVYFGCLLGMLFGFYEEQQAEVVKSRYLAFFILLAVFFRRSLPTLLYDGLGAILVIVFIPRLPTLDAFLSSRPVNFLGNISWDIYSFHYPVLCSFGALIMMKSYTGNNLNAAYRLAIGLSVLITLALSVLYYFTFDRWSTSIISLIKKKLFVYKNDSSKQTPGA